MHYVCALCTQKLTCMTFVVTSLEILCLYMREVDIKSNTQNGTAMFLFTLQGTSVGGECNG